MLDLSKTLMYDFHYGHIVKKYPGHQSKLLLTDADSLTYEIEAEDIYKDFHEDQHMFDNSDYPEGSPFHFTHNKKVIGKMKDEAAGCPITEFLGLTNKMYSYIKEDGKGGITAKKSVVKKAIKHNNYRQVLFFPQQLHHNMKGIRSSHHQLHSYKVSLSCFDDKRYLFEDGIKSHSYGHYKIGK